MYDTIFLTIHEKGGHYKGAGVESVVMDGEKSSVIYGATCPTSYDTN